MKVFASARTQCAMGGSIFDAVVYILNQNAPDFGVAIEELNLQPHFDDSESFLPDSRHILLDFKKKLNALPNTRFSRVNKALTLKYHSKICMGVDLYGTLERFFDPQIENKHFTSIENESASLLKAFCFELIQTLPVLRKTFKKTDDFDLAAFITWVESRIELLPKENKDVTELITYIALHQKNDAGEPDRSCLSAMELDEFWATIGFVDTQSLADGDERSATQPVLTHLKKLSADKIKSFHNHMSNALYALDTRVHYEAAMQPHSDDSYLYLRCYVVAMGRDYFNGVLANPSDMPTDFSCEALLNVVPEAWAEVTNDDPQNFDTRCAEKSYETGSNTAAWA